MIRIGTLQSSSMEGLEITLIHYPCTQSTDLESNNNYNPTPGYMDIADSNPCNAHTTPDGKDFIALIQYLRTISTNNRTHRTCIQIMIFAGMCFHVNLYLVFLFCSGMPFCEKQAFPDSLHAVVLLYPPHPPFASA